MARARGNRTRALNIGFFEQGAGKRRAERDALRADRIVLEVCKFGVSEPGERRAC